MNSHLASRLAATATGKAGRKSQVNTELKVEAKAEGFKTETPK